MSDVVDSDELLRRIQRARACAQEEVRALRARGADTAGADADAVRDARMRGIAYEAVLRVLDEIVTPGRPAEGH
jgi:hypothetical protein